MVREQEIAFKVDRQVNPLPTPLAVCEVNPKLVKPLHFYTTNRTTTGALVFFTTPTDQDIYIRSIVMNFAKDATCDTATAIMSVAVVIGATTKNIAILPMLTLTAQQMETSHYFGYGLKVDRGTAITTTTNAFTVGLCIRSCTISYFLDEVS